MGLFSDTTKNYTTVTPTTNLKVSPITNVTSDFKPLAEALKSSVAMLAGTTSQGIEAEKEIVGSIGKYIFGATAAIVLVLLIRK